MCPLPKGASPEPAQTKIQQELERDLSGFFKELDSLELKVFLSGPHDKSNCILSINAGAGGTESCDWASMLMRMYQRWVEARGWKVEVTDVLPGETAGLKSVRFEQAAAHQLRQRGRDCGNRGNVLGDYYPAKRTQS